MSKRKRIVTPYHRVLAANIALGRTMNLMARKHATVEEVLARRVAFLEREVRELKDTLRRTMKAAAVQSGVGVS